MFESWEAGSIIVVAALFIFLVFMTVMEIFRRRKIRRRKPQDHFFADRKRPKTPSQD